ncbi:hypothetical protein H5410_001676 [Solanum commersonii]|uniref:Non-LTR retroelement reverse transcriptase n=1 Tax=Solanum commersonii TaxID=4109 RepID=A0A9J6B0R5_SOLCO|nr:hypothetical protein H5410_001676 [Solanum commersonii]
MYHCRKITIMGIIGPYRRDSANVMGGGGDFNTIMNEEGEIGRIANQGFKESKYTWWNGRTDEDCIFKWLDRVLCNDEMSNNFTEVEHITRSGSDHSPLLLKCSISNEGVIKEETFKEVVKQNWNTDFEGNPFIIFHHKLKRVKRALSQWSKDTFGNIFQEIVTLKTPSKFLKNSLRSYNGRKNSGSRRRVLNGSKMMREIQDSFILYSKEVEQQDKIAEMAVEFYKGQFTKGEESEDFDMLTEIPRMITSD